jgi:hypothetical protein
MCNDPCSAPSDLTLVSAYTDSAFNPVNTPISVAAAPGDTSRLFIVERGGRIRLAIDSGSGYVVQDTPFLDVHSQVNTAGEGGLLSMAFDPEYAQTGLFYVYFANFGTSTAPTPPTPPTNPPSQQPPPTDGPVDQPSQDAQNSPTPTTPVATKDVVAPVLHVRAARTQDLLRRGDVRLAVACNEACVVRAAGSARGVRLRSMLKRLGAAKRVVFELRLSSRARRALAKRGTVKVTLRGRDAAGNVSTASLTVRVKRR